MAAYFYTNNNTDVFRIIPIISNVDIGFLTNFVNGNNALPSATGNSGGLLIVSEVVFQNRDTIQYFLTFDDLITYFYFGKGLGTMTVAGSIVSACDGDWGLFYNFMSYLGTLRGTRIGDIANNPESGHLNVGGISFIGILSSFTVRANTEPNSLNTIDFTLQLDIIDSSFAKPTIQGSCF